MTPHYLLAAEHELRIEVSSAHAPGALLRLASGSAEVAGVELAEGRAYALAPGRQLAVFTWYGAELVVSSAALSLVPAHGASSSSSTTSSSSSSSASAAAFASVYVSGDSQVPVYANLHQRLEARRDEARLAGAAAAAAGGGAASASAAAGPRVLVVGPADSGKSSLCRVLCAYACRVGRAPTFVDLDVGQGEVSVPGTLAATPLDRLCLSVEDGYAQLTPLAYSFGHASPGELVPVYRNYLARLADTVNRRLAADDAARAAGLVVNTMGWVDGAGYELLLDAVRLLQCDVVVVMGHDRLFAQLSEDAKALQFAAPGSAAGAQGQGHATATAAAASSSSSSSSAASSSSTSSSSASSALASSPARAITVVKLARPGGVVERTPVYRREARRARFRDYFYGPWRPAGVPSPLSPEVVSVRFEDVVILKVGGAAAEAGLVPVGRTSTLTPLRTQVVNPTAALVNHVLAVSFAASEAQAPHVNVAGFVHVRGVRADTRTLQLMLPCGGPLPGRFLLQGSCTWVEA
jgi:polyribonucleotide 5'-hydroxyl-kinase